MLLEELFPLSAYEWNGDALTLQPKDPATTEIDFNYMVFAVKRFSAAGEADAKPASGRGRK
jgi:hypothetical protein